MGRDWRSHRVAVTGLVAAGGGEMLWEMDCSGLQGLGDVWKMAMEDFFPHLVDLRILILIYGLRFHGFRGRSECLLCLCPSIRPALYFSALLYSLSQWMFPHI